MTTNGFIIKSEEDGGRTLVVQDRWSRDMDHLVSSGEVDGLDLNYAQGFKDTDLAFIRTGWPLKRVALLARTVESLEPLERLASSLESVRVQTAPTAVIDLRVFPRLAVLSCSWRQIGATIGDASPS